VISSKPIFENPEQMWPRIRCGKIWRAVLATLAPGADVLRLRLCLDDGDENPLKKIGQIF